MSASMLLGQLGDLFSATTWYVIYGGGMFGPLAGLLLSSIFHGFRRRRAVWVAVFYGVMFPMLGMVYWFPSTRQGVVICPLVMMFPFGILFGLALILVRPTPPPHREGICDRCGYDLRATPDRCPECGRAVANLTQSRHGAKG
jgi:hypothetical protein